MIGWSLAAAAAPLQVAESGHLLVHATVGSGEQHLFVLDTGASITLLAPELTTDLQVLRQVDIEGAGGEVPATLVRAVPLTVDGRSSELPYAVSMSVDDLHDIDPAIRGVLGLDVLRLGIVRVAPQDGTIDWWIDAPDATHQKLGKTRGRLLTTTLQLPGGEVTGVVDLGAHTTVLNHAAADELGGGSDSAERATSTGIDGVSVETEQQELARCEALGLERAPCGVEVADLPVFATLRMDRGPAAIVGVDLLGEATLVLDARRRRLWLE